MAEGEALLGAAVDKVCYQLQRLANQVQEMSAAVAGRGEVAEEDLPVFTIETRDPDELQRYLKADDALLALKEIVDGPWQREMIKYGGADSARCGKVMTPSEAMQLYRDHAFEVMQGRGISLEGLL